MDPLEWRRQYGELDSSLQGVRNKTNTSGGTLSARDQRLMKSKLDQFNRTLTSLTQATELWQRNPSKYGVSTSEVTQRVKELSQIKNNIMELELVVTTGKGGDARQKMFQGYDSSAYRPAEETEETMYSSNRDILQQQVQEIDTQDKALGNISRGLGNLKMMSQDMNKELTLQSGLLDDIEQGVDRTDAHLKSNIKRVNLVDEESDGGCCTCLLMFGLFALIVFLLTTNYACYIFNPKKC